jgi:hypothetical protein
MARLCERPGCSEDAAVAYGMRAEDLVFWLDALEEQRSPESGVLCLRHANSMVVPRGWTLDDLRDPDLRLFRPPRASDEPTKRSRRASSTGPANGEQLELGVDRTEETVDAEATGAAAGVASQPDETIGVEPHDERDDAAASDDDLAAPWVPAFDSSDDLDGLLSARSPLLARAFRGDDRPR